MFLKKKRQKHLTQNGSFLQMTCLRLRATGPMHSSKPIKIQRKNKLLRKTGDMGSFIKWYCKQIGKSKLVKADLESPAYKLVRPFHKNNISFQFQMEECHLLLMDQIDLVNPEGNRVMPDVSKPLPLGGPPGQLKAAYYQDFRLEELVPSLWIKSEREYDISSAYGISHWWFKRKNLQHYQHSAPFDCHAIRSHMKILSVVSLKTFSRYGYTFLREIVLRRRSTRFYRLSHSEVVDIEKVEVHSSLRLPNNKCALIEYEHVGPEVTRSQDDERPQDDDWRLHLADDLKEAQDHTQVELRNKLKINDQRSLHQSTRYQMKNQRLRAGTQEQS
ncbi:hypothetical protein Tco_1310823 [Tanacetum coccineum]